jgi:hypothetical protein
MMFEFIKIYFDKNFLSKLGSIDKYNFQLMERHFALVHKKDNNILVLTTQSQNKDIILLNNKVILKPVFVSNKKINNDFGNQYVQTPFFNVSNIINMELILRHSANISNESLYNSARFFIKENEYMLEKIYQEKLPSDGLIIIDSTTTSLTHVVKFDKSLNDLD